MRIDIDSQALSSIDNFGAVDADADTLLDSCFQDHPAYISVRDFQKFLVVGRKGSGKTAIYRKIVQTEDPLVFSLGQTFDDYPWNHHDLQAESGVPEERRYIHSWKYLILMSLSRILLEKDCSQPWSDEAMEPLGVIENFIVDSYGSRNPDLSHLFLPSRELKFKGKLKAKIAELDVERVKVSDLPRHIQAVNRAMLEQVLQCLNPDVSYYICFDQLDLGLTTSSPEYYQRMIGLLIAARDLFVAAKSQGKRLNIVVFLRDDIYQDLRFEDKNKITENYMVRVLWDERSEGMTLRHLMESRFNQVIKSDSLSSLSWGDVFDETREMPSRQTKYKHICDRTFQRPRDMIKFCNEVLINHNRSESIGRFSNDSIHAARDSYSDYLLNELDDEISKHVPNYREYLEVLKSIGSEKFSYDSFTEFFFARNSIQSEDPRRALEELFEYSVVSYLKPGGRGGGSEYVWRYKDPRARFDSTIDSFRVHPGFKEALDLIR